MNEELEEDKNEGPQSDAEIWIPPHLPVLDSPIKSGDNISDTSSVYEMSAPMKLSKFKTLLAGAMICVSEPVSEASDDDGNDSVVPLKNVKNHPDNQVFIFNPAQDLDYLFARPLTDKPFDGGRCLNKIKNMCNLKKPEMLTSTGLRHHIATISQVHSKTDDKYTQHLATFLGHDMQVHASNYRLPIQAIQKGLVGSRLMEIEKHSKKNKKEAENESESEMTESCRKEIEEGCKQTDSDTHSEENETNKNKAKITEAEININIIEENESDKIIMNEKNNKENYQQNESARCEERSSKADFTKERNKQTIGKKKKNMMIQQKSTSKQVQSSDTESSVDIPLQRRKYLKKKKNILTDDESDEEITKPKPKTRKKTHNKWSTDEVQAVMRHLKRFIQMKKNPGKALCEQVLRKEPVLHKRTWMQINTYINNIYKKNL